MLGGQETKTPFEVKEDEEEEGVDSMSLEKNCCDFLEYLLLKIDLRIISFLREASFFLGAKISSGDEERIGVSSQEDWNLEEERALEKERWSNLELDDELEGEVYIGRV